MPILPSSLALFASTTRHSRRPVGGLLALGFALGFVLAAVIVAPVGASEPSPAKAPDAVAEQLAQAQQLYQAGKLKSTERLLGVIADQLMEQQKAQLSTFLPPPPKGCTAEIVKTEPLARFLRDLGLQVDVLFKEERPTTPPGISMSCSILLDSPQLQQYEAQFLNDPERQKAFPNLKVGTFQGFRAIRQTEADQATMHLFVNASVMITVRGKGVSMETLEKLAGSIDLPRLKNAFLE